MVGDLHHTLESDFINEQAESMLEMHLHFLVMALAATEQIRLHLKHILAFSTWQIILNLQWIEMKQFNMI